MVQAFLSRTPVFMTLLGLLVLVTLGLVVLAPAVALLPMVLACVLWWLCRLPLRTLVLGLFCACVTVDLVNEVPYEGHWKSPLYYPGRLLYINLSNVIGVPGLGFPMLDIFVLGMLGLMAYRRALGQKIDPFVTSIPRAQVIALMVLPATIVWMQVWGIFINGGNARAAQWQWHQMMVLPLIVMLFNAAIRGPADFRILGRMIVTGCCIKALFGTYFILAMARPKGLYHEYATAHSDSVIFVTGLAIVIFSYMEEPIRKNFWRMVWVSLIILMGMHYNDRRLAYVSFILILAFGYAISPWSWVKRYATRAGLVLLPVFPFYIAAGWQNPTGIFSIVGIFKSLIEGETDKVEQGLMDYRDMENINVVATWEQNPLLGTGWGHPFLEVMKLPDISHAFPDYLYHPHNSVLGMLAFGGIVGFSGLWTWLVVSAFLAVRAYHRAHPPEYRAGGLVCFSVFIAYINQCYGDMGSISWLSTLLAAMALTCAGKLAVVTRAWPVTDSPRANVSTLENSTGSPVGHPT
jgi:hypothetical protein